MHEDWKRGPRRWLLAGALLVFANSVVSAQNYSRTETIVYSDNATSWVLGQVASLTVDGVVAEQTSYDPATALPVHVWKFGKTAAVMTYNADGTLATSTDGNGNQTTFSSWMRGVPQRIGYADGTSQSAIVSDPGWILQVTDQNGHATGFGYDMMGRLSSISHPSGDTVAWNNLVQSFVQIDASEYGIPAGHWRQKTTIGSYTKVSYFDALWRPLLVSEFDAGNPGGTTRFSGFEYDHQGRVVFASYPSAASNPDKGVWTIYDALGRVTSRALDSEQGLLTTRTSYQGDSTGAYTLVRDARGNEVRTWYQMFGEPAYTAPVRLLMPEGAVARIDRDVFGKPTSISRGNADGSQQVTRTYSYNGNQELCRTREPETGTTLMGYDGAGNLAWSAAGLAGSSSCESAGDSVEASQRKVGRTYDSRNRLKTLAFPDGNGNQSWTYAADGKPSQVVTQDAGSPTQVINTYTYNKRGLLIAETSGQAGGYNWSLGYSYDANASLAGIQYPSGLYVDYAPNALGQATQAGTYATGVAYYANGGMRQFVYGNGIPHSMQQNLRQLPARVSDAGVLDHAYSYDGSGNVLNISDALDGTRTRSMSYDGLDRLTKAVSTSFGGNGESTYSYDTLDNLRSSRLPGVRQYNYWYDAANRLNNIIDDAGATIIGLAYDAQGNLANKNGQRFSFDYGNRLREAVGKETYRYDAQGRRVASWAPGSGNIISMYGQDGLLRRQDNDRKSSSQEYVYLNGSLVAKVSTSTAPAAPVVSAPASSGDGIYTVSWSAVSTAARYELEQKTGGGAWQAIYSGSSLSLAMSGQGSGIYSYRARSCRSAGCGEWGNIAVVAVQAAPTGAPGVTAPERSGDGNYAVSWTAVSGAVSYRLEERFNSGGWVLLQNSGALSQVFASKADGSYAYRVSACNATGCGETSGVVVVQVLRLPGGVPAISAPQLSISGDYAVGWSSVPEANHYRFEESANGGNWTTLLDGPGASYAFSQKADGGYAYRVAACNAAGCGAFSPVASTQVRRPPASSPVVSAPGISSNGSFVVSWTAVAGADSYRLQESAGGAAWTQLQDAASLQAALSGKGDGAYAYRVAACNAGGCSGFSAVTNVQVVRPPGTPGLEAPGQSNNGAYTVSWSGVAGAGSYVLEESVNGGGWTQVQNSPATSFAAAGRGDGSYTYRVMACNLGGCGGYSGTSTVVVVQPPTTPSGVAARYIVVNFSQPWQVRYFVSWNAVPGATTYEVQSNRGNYSGPLTSIQINYVGTPPGGVFSVRACKSGVCSAWSPSVTANGG